MYKRATAVLLLIIFGFNAAGLFKVYRFMNRKSSVLQLRRQLRQKDLLTVTSPKGTQSLKEKGFTQLQKDEYEYKGHRYDVVRREEKDEQMTIYLVHDSYEEELLTFLHSFFNSGASNRQDQASSTLKLGILKHFLTSIPGVHSGHLSCSYVLMPPDEPFPPSPFQETPSPPPRQA